MTTPVHTQVPDRREGGFAMVLVLTTLIPALLLVAAFGSVLTSRTDELEQERGREKALHAAESGVDYAIFRGRRGLLDDHDVYDVTLAAGTRFVVEATHLLADGDDNDNDGSSDEPDEDVFQVVVTGSYLGHTRRLAAYLGPVPLLPDIRTAMAIANPAIDLRFAGSSHIDGFDAAGSIDVPALAIFQPGTIAQLSATLSGAEGSRLDGPGGPPSLGTVPAIDLNEVVSVVQNIADTVLTSAHYSGLQFGNAATNNPRITYRAGNVRINGNSSGAGILVVTGDLEVLGNFEFDGLVIVLGNISNSSGSARIRGAMVQGPAATFVDLRGNFDLQYSSSAIDLANSNTGLYVAFNGWQELAR
jgi:hypothetical protein